jgi:hypothetical protein
MDPYFALHQEELMKTTFCFDKNSAPTMYLKSETWAADCEKIFNNKYDEAKFSAKFASLSINKGAKME